MDVSKYYSSEYLDRARSAHPDVKIVPRVYVHGMQGDVFLLDSTNEEEHLKILSYFE
jgi:hypothetical protein